jgi:hypothetical protein
MREGEHTAHSALKKELYKESRGRAPDRPVRKSWATMD